MRAQVTTEKTYGTFLFAGITSAIQAKIMDWAQETPILGMVAIIIHRVTFSSGFTENREEKNLIINPEIFGT